MHLRRRNRLLLQVGAAVALVLAAFTANASARAAAVPHATALPSVAGQAKEGSTLTASNGSWAGSPTSFAYQWQRCAEDGSGCTNISGATSKGYTVASADVDHALRVVVTATNADGSTSASSGVSGLISAKDAPVNTAKPSVAGSAVVGETLTAATGTWTGGVRAVTFQWQRCTASLACTDIPGATGKAYGVGSGDVGQLVRISVTARNLSGTTTASSDPTGAVVTSPSATTTNVVTVQGNRPPKLTFLSLRRLGNEVYARFRVCDDRSGPITAVERDQKPRVLAYTRRFHVQLAQCATLTRHWLVIPRFRGHGHFVVTLRAIDASGDLSRLVSRSLVFH
jgi:hypothetical protein